MNAIGYNKTKIYLSAMTHESLSANLYNLSTNRIKYKITKNYFTIAN